MTLGKLGSEDSYGLQAVQLAEVIISRDPGFYAVVISSLSSDGDKAMELISQRMLSIASFMASTNEISVKCLEALSIMMTYDKSELMKFVDDVLVTASKSDPKFFRKTLRDAASVYQGFVKQGVPVN
jgi:hypothetical protein